MKFTSQFLDPNLRTIIDSVSVNNFANVKNQLVVAMSSEDCFSGMKGKKHINDIINCHTPKRLQQLYYSFILAAEGLKTIKN